MSSAADSGKDPLRGAAAPGSARRSDRARWWRLAPALALLLFGGGIYSLSNVARATQWLRHTIDVRSSVGRLRSTLTDAETGTVEYALSGDPSFLKPHQHAHAAWPAQLNRVRILTRDNPSQQQRSARLERRTREALSLLDEVRTLYDAGRRGTELSAAVLNVKRTTDGVREILREMEREEAKLADTRQRDAISRWRWSTGLLIGGAFVVLLIALAVWFEWRLADAQRRRAAELAQAHELFRIVVQGVDMGVTVQAKTGQLIYANDTAASIIGYASPEALLATPLARVMDRFEMFDADGAPFPPGNLPSRTALAGQAGPELLLRFKVRGSREERWSLVRSVPVFDGSGNVTYAINFFRDVTDKTRTELQRAFLLKVVDELNSSLDYAQTLSGLARLAVPSLADWCAVDIVSDGQVKRLAVAHVDPSKIDLVAELQRRYPSDPNAATGVQQVIRSGQPELIPEIPAELLRAAAVDAEHLRLIERLELRSYLSVPLRVRGKTIGALTFAMAESDRRHTEQDLGFAQAVADRAALAIENARLFQDVERARAAATSQLAAETERRRQAEETSRFAEMFIGMLGHDLRNPLNAVRMAVTLLKRKTDGESPVVDRIQSSTLRMSHMVDQLLDLTRSRLAGGIAIEKTSMELGALVSEVIDELRLTYPGREIRWDCREIRGAWDRVRLAQSLSNLVGNALEHGDPARPIEVRLSARAEGTAHLAVHSHGPPIPPDLLAVIFDPYQRAGERREGSKGLGLGLFITQQIVLAHGGRIDVRSSVDEGTVFDVWLPGAVTVTPPASAQSIDA